jgi:hypothetical protein
METRLVNIKLTIRILTGILLLFLFTGCSCYITKFYSQPSTNAVVPELIQIEDNGKHTLMSEFYVRQMPSIFADSISHSVIKVKLDNENLREIIGPPIIPFIPIWSGYGFESEKLQKKTRNVSNLKLHLSIFLGVGDTISFNPGLFLIRKTSTKGHNNEANTVSISDEKASIQFEYSPGLTNQHFYSGNHQRVLSFIIVFEPGIYVEDCPLVLLNTLRINNEAFHPDGILFNMRKKSFYSPFIAPL